MTRLALALALLSASPLPADAQAVAARAAEILKASGTVEVQHGPQAVWTPARTGQELLRGDSLRTHQVSIAQLTFTGAVQWQLSADSELNLEEALAGGSQSIIVRLERGGAVSRWTPDRRTSAAKMIVKTAGGQAVITGTEWSMRVDPDGRTALVVLDGSVELSNDRGQVVVHRNEAGEMRPGTAPALLRLITPQDRVQWVAAYSASPASHAAAGASAEPAEAIDRLERSIGAASADAAVYLAAADLLLEAGELARAGAQADAGRATYPADARFDAMLARIALFDDRPDDSRVSADRAIAKDPRGADSWIALGEWGIRQGDAAIAWRAFTTSTTVVPGDARGWFGAGTVATEREDFPTARRLLQRALTIDPRGPGYRGEVGTLETLANRLARAAQEYAGALAQRPDDYVTLTGRALLALKQAREADALDLLQRATFLEPRYARAQIYLGVAYYRLRRVDDALKALARATTLDPRDPLPYLMLTQIYTDTYQPWKAIEAARAGQARMPFLKSLNQLANSPKGGANLGNALAFFGMEDWAQHLAQESYSPTWAGSHLFLGDRYSDSYARTSEYFQGLLADPTVFGGSPGLQTLLQRPAHYVTVPFTLGHNQFDGFAIEDHTVQPEVTVNGLVNGWRPVAYAANVQTSSSGTGASGDSTTRSLVGSVGLAPADGWSTFGAVGHVQTAFDSVATHLEGHVTRADGGVQYRFAPTSSIAFKVGAGTADYFEAPSTNTGGSRLDAQIRYVFSPNPHHQASWGLALGRLRESFDVPVEFFGKQRLVGLVNSRLLVAYAADRWSAGDHLLLEGEVSVTAPGEDSQIGLQTQLASVLLNATTKSSVKTLPRLGAVVRFSPGRLVRLVYQGTTTPLGVQSSLAPVATAGIPLDESFDVHLGDVRRYRGQLEWQWSPHTFSLGFVDHKRFGETTSALDPFIAGLTDHLTLLPLVHLRNELRDVSQLNVASPPLLEDTVAVPPGSEATVIGLAVNHLLSRQVSMVSQYFWTRSSGPFVSGSSTRLPYYPDQAFSAGATWISPFGIFLSASAMYRSDRTGINNALAVAAGRSAVQTASVNGVSRLIRFPIAADWSGTMAASWDTPSKRWSVQALAADLFSASPVKGLPRRPSVNITVKARF